MSKPRVLIYDVETFPNIGATWGMWEQNVIKILKHWQLASFAYKWQGESDVTCVSQKSLSEKKVTKALWDLFQEADATIAHNGDAFDLKKARAKFTQFKLDPPTLSRSIDTKKIAKSQFGFTSNSLNDLGDFLGLGSKVDTGGKELWFDCMDGIPKAWDKMIEYNKQDVVLLEKVYLRLRPWYPTHPNLSILSGNKGCPSCGSLKVQSRGFRATVSGKQQRYQCQDCGHWHTGPLDRSKHAR